MELRLAITRADLSEFQRGYLDGLSAYAWWKDGTEYVGTTGRTLNQAIVSFLAEAGVKVAVEDVRQLR